MSALPTSVDPNLHDISLHVKPGKERAPFFRYFRFNLPKLTRAVIVAIMTLQGCLAWYVARSEFLIFPGQEIVLYLLVALCAVVAVLGAVTPWRVWDFGLIPAVGSLLLFVGGLAGTPPWGCLLYTSPSPRD